MYHYVRPIKGSSYPFIKGLELDEFKTQLNFLEKNYKIIFEKNSKMKKKNFF